MNQCLSMSASTQESEERLLAFVPPSAKRILHCHCGLGTFGERLKRRGNVEAWGGAWLDEDAAAAAERMDVVLPIREVLEKEGALPERFFDCVIVEELLEGLRDPGQALSRLRASMVDQGVLLAIVPNVQHYQTVFALAEGRWLPASEAAGTRRPLRFYTVHEITRLLKGRGFDVKACASFLRDPEASMRLDQAGFIRRGRVEIGPLSPKEHQAYLTRTYIALALKSEATADSAS